MTTLDSATRPDACRSVVSTTPVQVTWIVPDAPAHRQRLDEVCASVGPVVVQAPTRDAQVRKNDGSALTIVVWNTYLGRGNLHELVSRLERGEFTGGTPVHHFALLLQEVYRDSILAFARTHDLGAVYAPARRPDKDTDDRGGAILATSTLHDILIAELPFEKHRRVVVGAGLGNLHLINVHFDTKVGLFRGGPGAVRRRQARALMEAVERLPPPMVIAGDLNTWWGDDEPAVKELRQRFPDAKPVPSRDTWRGPFGTGNRLDYVFAMGIAPPISVNRLEERFGSDHWPLLAIVPVR